ncbi:amidohydrolase family protein [Shimia abyssi]|uniref:L-fuconolactonase n=1 Tax=Shimia abyssi TaxID=1662395 RepID=A0A2P8FER2_9RHOB|nr:amidohydrolase family protein [Shimia abyssi]PSL20158.1 L-fuconolactonase [Shimia abyssi]
MKIDTHQHFWKLDRGDYGWLTPDLAPLYRDFLPSDLKPLLDSAGIEGCIAVQAADTEAETEFLLSLADTHDWIVGVVGWVDLEKETAPESIARLTEHPKLVGLRPMIQDIPDDRWMLLDELRPAIEAMRAHNLTFDALVMPRHLPHLLTFLEKYDGLRVVVDHCAKPEIRDNGFEPWASLMAQVAQSASVFCKLSGLVTEAGANWTTPDLQPYVSHVYEIFGSDRVMFGSDWPVINLASDYPQWREVFSSLVQDQPIQETLGAGVAAKAYPRLG